MLSVTSWKLEMLPWYVLGIYWGITALRVKPTKSTEPAAARLFTFVLLVAAFGLLFFHSLPVSWLQNRFVMDDVRVARAGVALTYVGVTIALWARFSLGKNWSARVSLKTDHELIRNGPYAYVRHPIYTGFLLAIAGTAIVVGEWRGILALVLLVIAHSVKAKREESVMIHEFGERYLQYRQQTGFLFPRI